VVLEAGAVSPGVLIPRVFLGVSFLVRRRWGRGLLGVGLCGGLVCTWSLGRGGLLRWGAGGGASGGEGIAWGGVV